MSMDICGSDDNDMGGVGLSVRWTGEGANRWNSGGEQVEPGNDGEHGGNIGKAELGWKDIK
jgi:hypothetical protein